jgi:hypothetical protein
VTCAVPVMSPVRTAPALLPLTSNVPATVWVPLVVGTRRTNSPCPLSWVQLAVSWMLTATGAHFLGPWRLMSIDGLEWDVPDTRENAAPFGYSGKGPGEPGCPAFPKVRVVTISECGSHAVVEAEIGGVAGKGAGEQSLARRFYRRLEPGWLLIADRYFY